MHKTLILFAFLSLSFVSHAQTYDEVGQMEKFEGFFDFYYDEDLDKIYLEVDRLEEEFLYIHSLSSGLGSNDLGLDRGQIGGEKVVYFRKAGDRMLLVEPNLDYRAVSDNALEKKAVEQAFARSVIYSFPILEEKEGAWLIDLGNMLLSDAHSMAERLRQSGQGSYALDPSRSALELERTKGFPENVEFDVMLTFNGSATHKYVREVSPDSRHITVNQHHSFVKLPDDAYQPRNFHPGSGCISISHMDYATPVFEPLRKQFILRHRLQKLHPGQAVSKPVEPIVYYLDNGTPEPIRSALLEGAGWWEEAFREIGFKDAFRVELLPEDADPMDVRYNVIQWVHRATRGWSYGNAVADPRTGEIIKGHVSLGSLRVRQDFLIAQALLHEPYKDNDESHEAMMDMALARIRQLSVHEIGHTLGFQHNYAASSNARSSVMDYPHPLVNVENGMVVLDNAYARGIGEWDKVTIAYAYTEFSENEEEGLIRILEEASERGLRFISDHDARARGGAHPNAHLWDNGASAVKELRNILEVRETAIRNFSIDNIPAGQPVSVLEDVFVPLYFFHRYQVEAAVKLIGGLEYSYQVKGDKLAKQSILDAKIQNEALEEVLHTLSPEVLMIPEDKLELFPPRAPGFYRTRESFSHMTGVTFDYLAPAAASANTTLSLLLHPERANRMLLQKARFEELPGPKELIHKLIKGCFRGMDQQEAYQAEVAHTIRFVVIDHLLRLAADPGSYPQVKAITNSELEKLKDWLKDEDFEGLNEIYAEAYRDQIKNGAPMHLEHLPVIPPGSPIGMGCMH